MAKLLKKKPLPATGQTVRGDPKVIFGWAMYDWANSAYITTVAVAILPLYFATVVVPPQGFIIGDTVYAAETLWGFMVSAAAFVIFLLAPGLGAIADFCSAKKRFLFSFCYLGVVSSIFLSFCGAGNVWPTIILFVISQIGFVGANVFYDAFLPQIAESGQEDRISSKGFAYGYAGGAIQFCTALILLACHDFFRLSQAEAARIGMLSAALWWGGFALITARYLKEPRVERKLPDKYKKLPAGFAYLVFGVSQVWQTLRQVSGLRNTALFLVSFLVYNEGIQTVILMATIYGKQELHLSATALMITLLLVQVVAVPGSLFFAWISGKTGTKKAIMLSLLVWCGVVVYAYFIHTATEYFILGAIAGLVLGGSQAMSRSLYASMIPPDSAAKFFGFYSVVNKFSAVWGPFIFALIRHWSGSSRNAILSLIVFFILGMLLLTMVDENRGRKTALE